MQLFFVRNIPFVGEGYLQGHPAWKHCGLVKGEFTEEIS